MDGNILASIVGNNNPAVQNQNRDGGKARPKDLDHEMAKKFAKLLDVEEKKVAKKDGKKPANDMGKKVIEREKEAREEESSKASKQKSRERLIKMSPLLNYLYNLMYKDPNALTNVERRMAGMDKMAAFGQYDVQYSQLKKMLSQRGMKLSDLNFVQMSKLAKTKNSAQVGAYLDQLSKEMKTKGSDKKGLKNLVEKGKEAQARRAEGKTAEQLRQESNQNLRQAMGTDKSARTDKSQELFNRKEALDQIISKIDIRNLNEQTNMVMKLNPEFLGGLKLMISKKDDKLQARFETTSKQVRELIEESVDELTAMFKRKGLKIADAKVKLVDSVS